MHSHTHGACAGDRFCICSVGYLSCRHTRYLRVYFHFKSYPDLHSWLKGTFWAYVTSTQRFFFFFKPPNIKMANSNSYWMPCPSQHPFSPFTHPLFPGIPSASAGFLLGDCYYPHVMNPLDGEMPGTYPWLSLLPIVRQTCCLATL